jgi:hypothetical protein
MATDPTPYSKPPAANEAPAMAPTPTRSPGARCACLSRDVGACGGVNGGRGTGHLRGSRRAGGCNGCGDGCGGTVKAGSRGLTPTSQRLLYLSP